ncbi:hypothetical protein CDCA_CDCA18G4566 [Cyanidium caldarium]|uniref:Phosphoglycerate mutase n=1 Tax=Cyanidium caldarium TaxID=2771 RepID=A0AAV9J2L7_CYACA|nr:hypothetical protein CDCA_CDCA18G4566 [Cyanidium caldarium]
MHPRLRLLLIRHGESEANLREPQYIAGRSAESALTTRGEQQARRLGQRLAHMVKAATESKPIADDTSQHRPPHLHPTVFASPLKRAQQTAAIVISALPQSPSVHTVDALAEIFQGEWEDAPREQVLTPETLQALAKNPFEFHAPGGESPRDVERRASGALHTLVQQVLAHGAAPDAAPTTEASDVLVLVFTHGFVIKCLLRNILDAAPAMTARIRVDNAAVVELWLQPHHAIATDAGVLAESAHRLGDWYLVRVNDALATYDSAALNAW